MGWVWLDCFVGTDAMSKLIPEYDFSLQVFHGFTPTIDKTNVILEEVVGQSNILFGICPSGRVVYAYSLTL